MPIFPTNHLHCFRIVAASMVFAVGSHLAAAELGVSVDDEGATITIDGELFTRYVKQSGTKPILYPVIGPTGDPMTRDYPMRPAGPHEKSDHPHHRSIWFGYEGINGVNFWHEPEPGKTPTKEDGRQRHKRFTTVELDKNTVLLVAETDYLDGEGKVVAEDERTVRFGAADDIRWIDYTIKLWSPEGPLEIGDTKEGAFAVRVAGTMKVDAKLGGKIVSSNGDTDADAWGKPAAWVDYSGPVADQTVGIAMMAHPQSLSAEPRWHVRTYGLFAANPIGAAAYTNGEVQGGLTRPEGEAIVLRHRLVLHRGNHEDADVDQLYEDYASGE